MSHDRTPVPEHGREAGLSAVLNRAEIMSDPPRAIPLKYDHFRGACLLSLSLRFPRSLHRGAGRR